VRRNTLLVQYKHHYSSCADAQRYECSPRAPGILDTAPGNRDQETGCGSDKEYYANPINLSKLGKEVTVPLIELQKYRGEIRAKCKEGYINPESPSPRNILREAAAEKWASDGTKSPRGAKEAESLASFA
jgi:hypothetical protein